MKVKVLTNTTKNFQKGDIIDLPYKNKQEFDSFYAQNIHFFTGYHVYSIVYDEDKNDILIREFKHKDTYFKENCFYNNEFKHKTIDDLGFECGTHLFEIITE